MDEETRRGPVSGRTWAKLAGIVLVSSAVGIAIGLTLDWFPVQGSTIAHKIDTFWDVLLIASIPIFCGVVTIVGFSVARWRMRPGEEQLDGAPIHGNTRLEVIWTAVPSVIIAALCAYAVVLLLDIQKAPAKDANTLVVNVTGQQFAWTFSVEENGTKVDAARLVLPVDRTVTFNVRSKDVLHDFWVPAFRLKVDAVPGITTHYSVTPNKLGRFDVVCAELCGLGHAYMRQFVNVVKPERYQQWLTEASGPAQTAAPASPPPAAAAPASPAPAAAAPVQPVKVDAKLLFTAGRPATGATACGACHTLKAAGTTATTGPALDAVLKGWTASRIRTAILKPDDTIAKGYGKGIMPSNFGQTLKPAEIDALVGYLTKSVNG